MAFSRTPAPSAVTGAVSVLLSALLLAVAAFATPARAVTALGTHPHLQCSVCHAIAEATGIRMNETARLRQSVKTAMRSQEGSGGKMGRYVDYESSELRAVEILEKVCADVVANFSIRQNSEGLRFHSNNKKLHMAQYYASADKGLGLKNVEGKTKEACNTMVEEQDELLTNLIRVERDLTVLRTKLCEGKEHRVCATPEVHEAEEKDRKMYKKFLARRKATRDQIDEDERQRLLKVERAKTEAEAPKDREADEKKKEAAPAAEGAAAEGATPPAPATPAAAAAEEVAKKLADEL